MNIKKLFRRKKEANILSNDSYEKLILADDVFTLRFKEDTFVLKGDEIRITVKHKIVDF